MGNYDSDYDPDEGYGTYDADEDLDMMYDDIDPDATRFHQVMSALVP